MLAGQAVQSPAAGQAVQSLDTGDAAVKVSPSGAAVKAVVGAAVQSELAIKNKLPAVNVITATSLCYYRRPIVVRDGDPALQLSPRVGVSMCLPRGATTTAANSSATANATYLLYGGASLEEGTLDELWSLDTTSAGAECVAKRLSCGTNHRHRSEGHDMQVASPPARYEHAAWMDNGSMYVWGGAGMGQTGNTITAAADNNNNKEVSSWSSALVESPLYNDLWRLDAATHQWTRMITRGTAPSPRTAALAASLVHSVRASTSRVYLWSGGGVQGCPVDDGARIHVLDMATSTWFALPVTSRALGGRLPSARTGHAMMAVGEQIWMFGGMMTAAASEKAPTTSPASLLSDELWMFDTVRNEWDVVEKRNTPWPSARSAHAAVVLHDRWILIHGGLSVDTHGELKVVGDAWLFDTVTRCWRELPLADKALATPEGRMSHAMAVLPVHDRAVARVLFGDAACAATTMVDKVLLFGGNDFEGVRHDLWILDPWDGVCSGDADSLV